MALCLVLSSAFLNVNSKAETYGQTLQQTFRQEVMTESHQDPRTDEKKAKEKKGPESEPVEDVPKASLDVILGDEQFDEYIPLLQGKRVALFTNHTGIIGDVISGADEPTDPAGVPFGKNSKGEDLTYGVHIIDALIEKNVDLTALFCPEHGLRGTEDAGAAVDS